MLTSRSARRSARCLQLARPDAGRRIGRGARRARSAPSLLAMVAGLPKTKNGRARGARGARRGPRRRCCACATTLLELVDRDAAAYDLVVAAFRQPKGTDEEKAARNRGDPGRDARRDRGAGRDVCAACAEALVARPRRGRARQPVRAQRRRRRRPGADGWRCRARCSTSRSTSAASRMRPWSIESPQTLRAAHEREAERPRSREIFCTPASLADLQPEGRGLRLGWRTALRKAEACRGLKPGVRCYRTRSERAGSSARR